MVEQLRDLMDSIYIGSEQLRMNVRVDLVLFCLQLS